jgi:hypothetical protein
VDETREREILQRLQEILQRLQAMESKLDTVIAFTGMLEQLAAAWTSGGRGRLLSALVKAKGGGGT